jgi:PAS domain S-box-containing protein
MRALFERSEMELDRVQKETGLPIEQGEAQGQVETNGSKSGTDKVDIADHLFPFEGLADYLQVGDAHSRSAAPKGFKGDEFDRLSEVLGELTWLGSGRSRQLRRAYNGLVRQGQLLRAIMDMTPDLVSLQDVDLVYRAANKSFCKYLNRQEDEVLGHTDFDIFSEYQADQNYHEDKQILMTGKTLSKEITVRGEKNRRCFYILKVPVYAEQQIIGLLLMARDITVLKQYQEQLVHAQKMEDLGRLAGGIAHEINTPLGIILGYTQLLLEDLEGEDQRKKDLRIIEKQTRICRQLVADLLGFSRQSGFTREEMDLNASIQEVISLVEHTFGLNKVFVRSDFDPNIPPMEADKECLRQVWMNLFNNAFDAIGENGCIFVRTKLCAHRRRVVVTIADTGPGINESDLDKIFDPFFSTKPVGKGTGLGLSVSFGIIKDHGGRISALSPAPNEYMPSELEGQVPVGAGTVFVIELPILENILPEEDCDQG